jgi:hypothetical protein
MNIIKKQLNASFNSNNKNSQKSRIMTLSKEDQELFDFIKNYNYSNNKVKGDFNLIQSPKKNKHEEYKAKLLNQIGAISNKILSEKTQEEKNQEKIINDLLYKKDFKYDLEKRGMKYNHLDKSQSLIKRKLLPKLSPQNKYNQLNKSNKDILLYSRIKTDDNYEDQRASFSDLINADKKNEKYYLLIRNNINGKKQQLPPVNKFKWNYHKLKLDKNNAIDYTDQKHEEMMKLYKELEYKKKNRFVI